MSMTVGLKESTAQAYLGHVVERELGRVGNRVARRVDAADGAE